MSIIIVGGGMVGATLALAVSSLTQGQLPIHLIEATSPGNLQHPGFDARVIALAQGTCQQLARIGVWPALADCATPITRIHVSDQGHVGFVELHAAHYGVEALGQVVELHDVGQRLFKLLAAARGVHLHCPGRLMAVDRRAESVSVTLDGGKKLQASLLVAADGAQSALAQACGIRWQQQSYNQVAIIANVSTSEPHYGRAYERFTPFGPLALLPMSNGRCSLVWCHPLNQSDKVSGWSDEHFLQQLQHAFGWRLGRMQKTGVRHAYPLQLLIANGHIGHRLAVVGNAAQTLHPIAGQGFNLGLRDVMTLSETIAEAWQRQDIGSYRNLGRYQQRRQPDQRTIVGITDGLVRLFANGYTPLILGRNFGLMTMEALPLLRDVFTHHTLGWSKRQRCYPL